MPNYSSEPSPVPWLVGIALFLVFSLSLAFYVKGCQERAKGEPVEGELPLPRRPAIPGVMPVDCYGPFVDRNFTRKTTSPRSGIMSESLSQSSATVLRNVSIDHDANRVFRYSAIETYTIGQPQKSDFIRFAASLPVAGVSPAEISRWAYENSDRPGTHTRTVGGATYRVGLLNGRVASMSITPADSQAGE